MRLRDDDDRKGVPLGPEPFPYPPAICVFGPWVIPGLGVLSPDRFLVGQGNESAEKHMFLAPKPRHVKVGTSEGRGTLCLLVLERGMGHRRSECPGALGSNFLLTNSLKILTEYKPEVSLLD